MSSVTTPDPPAAPSPAHAAASPVPIAGAKGAITLARHGEPALSRRVKLNAAGYRRWWAAYEAGGILPGQTPPEPLLALARRADAVFASTRPRAIETARAVAGDRPFVERASLVEAPLPPPGLPAWIRLNPRAWGFLARVGWWYFGHHENQESRAEAEARARRAAAELAAAASGGREVLVLAHGFFNAMVARELKRLGWRKVEGRSAFTRYWQSRRFEPG